MTSNQKHWITSALCGIVGSVIYKLPYLREVYYDAMQQATGAANAGLGFLMTTYGLVNFLLYLPDGWAADRFSTHKLTTFSLTSTGINDFYYAAFPSYAMICLPCALWAVIIVFTFWAVCVRIIRTLGTNEEQGCLYDYWLLGKRLTSIVPGFLPVPVFAKFGEGVGGLRAIIIFYSVVTILVGILAWFVCQGEAYSEDEANFRLADMAFVLKMSTARLTSIVTFCVWSIYIGFGMITPYLTQIPHMGESEMAVASVLRAYVLSVIGGLVGGQLAGRCASRTRFMIYTLVGMTVFTTVYFFLPDESRYVTIALANMVALNVFTYSTSAVFSSIIDEVQIPVKVTGIAAGLISLLTYPLEIYCYTMVGNMADRKPGIAGYQDVSLFMLVCVFIGLIAALAFQRVSHKSKNQVNEITENSADCAS